MNQSIKFNLHNNYVPCFYSYNIILKFNCVWDYIKGHFNTKIVTCDHGLSIFFGNFFFDEYFEKLFQKIFKKKILSIIH